MSWRNLGQWDRAVRVILGLALLAVGFSGAVSGVGGVALSILGWLPLVTGILAWDPIYALLGTRTRRD